eukprot:420909_1
MHWNTWKNVLDITIKGHHMKMCIEISDTLPEEHALREATQIDVFNEVKRKEICEALFDMLFDSKHRCSTIQDDDTTADMIGLEIIIHERKFRNVLQLYHTVLLKENNRSNFRFLIVNIHYHRLQIKYIFSQCKLWKLFLLAIISNIINSQSQIDSWRALLHTMSCWKYKHYQFIMQNGIINAVVHSIEIHWNSLISKLKSSTNVHYRRALHTMLNNLPNAPVTKQLQHFYFLLKHHHKKHNLMHKYQKFKKIIYNRCKQLESNTNDNSEYGKRERLYYQKMGALPECTFYNYDGNLKHCGWYKCTIQSEKQRDATKWYICKGCKLVYYCSKKHQKKHWNCAHSSQCKQLRKMKSS